MLSLILVVVMVALNLVEGMDGEQNVVSII